jgi:HK97 family phage portal protein
MGLFDRMILKALTNMRFPSGRLWTWVLPRTRFNYKKEVGDGYGSSVIMGPMLWLARTFPEAPVVLEEDEEIVRDHELLSLLRKPNPFYSGTTLAMATIINFALQGNAYWLKLRNAMGAVKELWHVPYWMIEPKWPRGGNEYISHYEYKPGSVQPFNVEVSDVVHFRFGLDDKNIRKGLAPLHSLVREVFTDDEAANYTAAILRNAGVPGLVISPEGDSPAMDDDAEGIKSWFKEKFGGDRRGEPLVMKGATKVEQFGFSPSEMDLGKLRNIPEERVSAILGIPAAVVGFGTGLQQTKVGATMAELREMAYENCIIPMQRIISEDMTNQLLIDFDESERYSLTYDRSKVRVLQEDQNRLNDRMDKAVRGGWVTVADAQRQMGYEVDESQDVYLRSPLSVPVPKGEEPQAISFTGGGNGEATEEDKSAIKAQFAVPVKIISPDDQAALIARFNRDERRLTRKFAAELVAVFEEIGEEAARIWLRIAEERGIEQLSRDDVEMKDLTDEAIYADLIAGEVNYAAFDYSPHFLDVTNATFRAIKSITGLAVNLTDQVELRMVALGGTRRGLIDLHDQTYDALFNTLVEAREAGLNPLDIAREIRTQIPAGPWSTPEIRAEVIARTETKYSQNAASLEAYRSVPEIDEIQIVDAQLGATDEICEILNGAIVSFEDAEYWLQEEHPNGTRSFTPVVTGHQFNREIPSQAEVEGH